MSTIAMVWTRELDNRLCDLVAEDAHTFGEIAELMNLPSRNMVTSRWRRIVQQLGYQAVWPTPAGPGQHRLSGEQQTATRP